MAEPRKKSCKITMLNLIDLICRQIVRKIYDFDRNAT